MGGNVFNNTSSIKKENIYPTLDKFYNIMSSVFPNSTRHFSSIITLGSVGKKEESGDIDIAMPDGCFADLKDWGIDESEIQILSETFRKRSRNATDDKIRKRSIITRLVEIINNSQCEIKASSKSSGNGSLHAVMPQYNKEGEIPNRYVQIDLNIGDIDWLKFAYHSSSYSGNVKGLHRTQLMLSLFTYKEYVFSHNYGVKNKNTQIIEAKNPSEAILLLNRLYGFNINEGILSNYFSLYKFLIDNLSKMDLSNIFDIYLKILDRTRTDIPENLQKYWIDNKECLSLTGKFLPDNSKLKKNL